MNPEETPRFWLGAADTHYKAAPFDLWKCAYYCLARDLVYAILSLKKEA